jgi:AcrR family transcriptional regulator
MTNLRNTSQIGGPAANPELAADRPLVYYTDQWSIIQDAASRLRDAPAGRHDATGRTEIHSRRSVMPRIVKHPEQRRGEILDCAQGMFLEHGYEHASLNDVIAAAGVSKGAFYHYFPSKEALLEALAERLAQAAIGGVQDILNAPGLDALTRLNTLMSRLRQNKIDNAATEWALFEVLFRPENLVLFHRINVAAGALFRPVLTTIVVQGVKDGSFDTFDPEGVADMILQLGGAVHGIVAGAIADGSPAQMNKAIRTLGQRIKLYEIALDRILRLPDGSVRLAAPGYVRTVMRARNKAAALRTPEENPRAKRRPL